MFACMQSDVPVGPALDARCGVSSSALNHLWGMFAYRARNSVHVFRHPACALRVSGLEAL